MYASQWGQFSIIQYLLSSNNNIDINKRNNNNENALNLAMKNGHRDIVTLLRSYGAK